MLKDEKAPSSVLQYIVSESLLKKKENLLCQKSEYQDPQTNSVLGSPKNDESVPVFSL